MPRSTLFCRLLLLLVVSGVMSQTRLAHAWIEKRVVSSSTLLDLERDGTATVRYELSIEVRGAPLQGLVLDGIDTDAEPLADGTITRMKGNVATSLPLPLQLSASAGRLTLDVPLDKGFRGHAFTLRFGYRTKLLERGLIQPLADARVSELRWVGPRFDDGVDSVTLSIRTDAGARAPEAAPDSEDDASGAAANFGIVMSTLRRSAHQDELELVRSHIARGEAMLWRVRVDSGLFATKAPAFADTAPIAAEPTPPAEPRESSLRTLHLSSHWPWLLLGGVLYALLVRFKAWRVSSAAKLVQCRPRALVGWRASWRAAFAGVSLASAATLSLLDQPLLAAAALLLCLALATERTPRSSAKANANGDWQTFDPSVLQTPSLPSLPGAWLDAGRPQGFLLLIVGLGGATWLAARLFESSPYYGVCALLGSTALLPIFCSGREGQLPLDARIHSRRFLRRAHRRLRRIPALVVMPIGKQRVGQSEPEELRLSITPERGLPGLLGIELGLEFQARLGGFCARPVVIVRAAEGSPCQRALPRSTSWMRGRKNDERATLIRPKLPTAGQSVALVQELLGVMRPEAPDASSPSRSKAAKSSGKGLSTAKAGTRASPAHAT